jgi:hypothetical protein
MNHSMKLLKLARTLVLSLALALTHAILFADAAFANEPHWAAPVQSSLTQSSGILKNWDTPAYMGTVLESSAPGTIGKPPSSLVDFQQTLRGAPIVGPRLVVWTRVSSVVTVLNADCNTKPYDPKRNCELVPHEPHLAEPSTPPAVGEKLIIFALKPDNVTKYVSVRSAIPGVSELLAKENTVAGFVAYPATAQHLATFEKHALLEERFARKNMGTLFLLVIATSAAALMFAFVAPKISILCALAMFSTYALYESGIHVQENIRVDLLIIYPALFLGVAAVVVSLVRMGKKVLKDLPTPDSQ